MRLSRNWYRQNSHAHGACKRRCPSRRPLSRPARAHGYVLLPVVLALTLLATVAWLINYQGGQYRSQVDAATQAVTAEQVARAGLAHAAWQASNDSCMGDRTMTSTAFAGGSYTASIDSPATATTEYTITPDRDTWIKESAPEDNRASDVTLSVKNKAGDSFRSLYHFDLSAIPAGARVVSARLQLRVDSGDTLGAVQIHPVTNAWTETGATWNSIAGSFDPEAYSALPPNAGAEVFARANLTALVQSWLNNPADNHGIMLIATSIDLESKYFSRESSGAEIPALSITVADTGVSPVTVSATGTVGGVSSPANDITRTVTRAGMKAHQPATTRMLQPGPNGKDAYLLSGSKAWHNTGSGKQVWISGPGSTTHNGLFEFSLASIPSGARVLSATLGLYSNSTDLVTAGELSLHRVTTGWLEGTGVQTGTTPPDGVTFDFYDGVNAWNTPGGDYDPESIGTAPVPDIFARWYSFDVTGTVSDWVDGINPNYGFLVRASAGTVEKLHFITGDDATADPSLHPKLTVTYACECGSPCMGPQGSGTVLLVVVNPATLVPHDAYKKALFESWGYTVNLISESANQASYDAGVASADVVYISETVNSFQVGTKLASAPIGVIAEDGAYNDDLGISNNAGVTVGSTLNVTATGAGHYITRVFPVGPLPIYAADMEVLAIFNGPAPDLQTLADIYGNASLVTLEAGATLKGGATAPGRRVMLPLGRVANFNWDYLNANGRLLVQRALQWGMGNLGLPPQNLLLVVGNTGSLTTEETAHKNLVESWGYAVELIDDGADQASFDGAVAGNDVVLITNDVTASTVDTKLVNATIGVVTSEVNLSDEFGMSASVGWDSGTQIEINDNSHYITQPFSNGLMTILSSTESLAYVTGTQSPSLGQLASTTSGFGVVTLEAGAATHTGGAAAGRRVLLPWGGNGFNPDNLNGDGKTLLQRALEWGAGAGDSTPSGYLDEFNAATCDAAVDYAGSDGLADWSGWQWTEVNETDGPCAGQIQITTDPLIADPGSNRLQVTGAGVKMQRQLDLSGFTSPALSFDYRLVNYPLDDFMRIRISTDGGLNWTELDRFTGPLDHSTYQSASYDVSAFIDVDTLISFEFNGISSTRVAYLDNIHIQESGGGGGGGGPPPACAATFADDFETDDYTGSTGTAAWAGDWTEINDSGNPGNGDVTVSAASGNLVLQVGNSVRGAQRVADLSGHALATLELGYWRSGLDGADEYATVEVSTDGSNWTLLDQFMGPGNDPTNAPPTVVSYDISAHLSATTHIRFVTSGNNSKFDRVLFDDIEICANN